MERRLLTFVIVLFLVTGLFSADVEGGNVTEVNITGNDTSVWIGVVGNVHYGVGVTFGVLLENGTVYELNITADDIPCVYRYLYSYVIASNVSTPHLPLHSGNLTKLDLFINRDTQSATRTFMMFGELNLSYGNYSNVPYTLSFSGTPSIRRFPTYYLDDDDGNIVFVANVTRGTSIIGESDYQILLPTNGSPMTYYFWVDNVYECVSGGGGGPSRDHVITILPIGNYSICIADTLDITFTVCDVGDYTERNVHTSISGDVDSTVDVIPLIYPSHCRNTTITITPHAIGNFTLTANAENGYAEAHRDFNLEVTACCLSDDDCGDGYVCDDGVCVEKKGCTSDDDCSDSQYCDNGTCTSVPCDCGFVENHTCYPYECCEDEDCDIFQICEEHVCIDNDFFPDPQQPPVEDNVVDVRFTDLRDDPIVNVKVVGDGYTDENGIAPVKMLYSGNVCLAFTDSFVLCKKINVIRKLFILSDDTFSVGEDALFTVVDSKGIHIEDAMLYVDGYYMGNTSYDGTLHWSFGDEGEYTIAAVKDNYLPAKKIINVVANKCYIPLDTVPVIKVYSNNFLLAYIISGIMMVITFYIGERYIKWRRRISIPYSLIPVIGAILTGKPCLMFTLAFIVMASAIGYYIWIRHRGRVKRVKANS